MKRFTNIFILLCGALGLQAQPDMLPSGLTPNIVSPEAYSFAKYGETPVDEYTGVPDISIPLYTISDGPAQIPITLRYHAGGIRVEEEASWVGLGWNLNVGGVITRIANGKPDSEQGGDNANTLEHLLGTSDDDASLYNNVYSSPSILYSEVLDEDVCFAFTYAFQYLDLVSGNGQADYYSFSMPGYSGKFFIDYGHSPTYEITYHFVDKTQGLKVIDFNNALFHFTIVDKNGIQYFFENDVDCWDNSGNSYNTETYLSKIIYTNGDIVFFTYSDEPDVTKYSFSQFYSKTNFDSQTIYSREYSPKYLHQIKSNNFTVTFNLNSAERLDCKGERYLTNFEVYHNSNPSKIFKYNFSTHYSSVSSPAVGTCFEWDADYQAQCNQRLMLDNLTIEKGGITQRYDFEYNQTLLPARNSFARDYWGYYNGKTSNTSIMPNRDKFFSFSDYDFGASGVPQGEWPTGSANMGADATSMQAQMLTKITYPTKGYTTFEYEPNSFFNYYYERANHSGSKEANAIGGGLRIKRILNYTEDHSIATQKNYSYDKNGVSTGLLYVPLNYFDIRTLRDDEDPSGKREFRNIFSSSSISLSTVSQAGNVGYSEVTITEGDVNTINGSVQKSFYNVPCDFLRTAGVPPISTEPRNGKLNRERIYNSQGTLVKMITYNWGDYADKRHYYCGAVALFTARVFCTDAGGMANYQDQYTAVIYPMISWFVVLNSKITSDFLNGQEISTTESYSYNNWGQVSSQNTTNSKNETLITKFKYPTDFTTIPAQAPLNTMRDKNMINYVIEQQQWNGTNLIGATYNKYTNNTNPKIGEVYQLETITPLTEAQFNGLDGFGNLKSGTQYQKRTTVDSYDIYGNLLQYHAENGNNTSFIWGYNNTYPIAKIENTTYNEVLYSSFEPECSDALKNMDANITGVISHTGNQSLKYVLAADKIGASGWERRMEVFNWKEITSVLPKKYTYSGWFYSDGPKAEVKIVFKREDGVVNSVSASSTTTGKWTHISGTYELPESFGGSMLTHMSLWVAGDDVAGNIWFDDLRLHPADAQMTTYTYDPLIGMTSETDINGKTTRYIYDDFGRLIKVLDHNGNAIRQNRYNYAK